MRRYAFYLLTKNRFIMAKRSETGHAVNAANFVRIIKYCEELGGAYTPPDEALSIEKLLIKAENMKNAIADYNAKSAPWVQSVNEREYAIAPLNKLLTRVRNLVKACAVKQQFKDDVSSLVKEIQGVRAKAKVVTEPENPLVPTSESVKNISAAQTGYDNRLNNFDRLIELLKVEPGYTPEEDDLKISALEDLQTVLEDRNHDVASVTPAVDNARILRDAEMYTGEGSGADLAGKVKAYFKAKFGGQSREFYTLTKWEFRKLVK